MTSKTGSSRRAPWIAGGYLLLIFALAFRLIRDGYVGHGNGAVFLLVSALTSPLSLLLLRLDDSLSDVNAFHKTGWPYLRTLCELGAGALFNAGVTYRAITFLQRKWQRE